MTTLFAGDSVSGILKEMGRFGAVTPKQMVACGKTANGKWRVSCSRNQKLIIDCNAPITKEA